MFNANINGAFISVDDIQYAKERFERLSKGQQGVHGFIPEHIENLGNKKMSLTIEFYKDTTNTEAEKKANEADEEYETARAGTEEKYKQVGLCTQECGKFDPQIELKNCQKADLIVNCVSKTLKDLEDKKSVSQSDFKNLIQKNLGNVEQADLITKIICEYLDNNTKREKDLSEKLNKQFEKFSKLESQEQGHSKHNSEIKELDEKIYDNPSFIEFVLQLIIIIKQFIKQFFSKNSNELQGSINLGNLGDSDSRLVAERVERYSVAERVETSRAQGNNEQVETTI